MATKIYVSALLMSMLFISGCSNQLPTSRVARESIIKAKEVSIPSKGIKHTNLDEAKEAEAYYEQRGEPELQAKYLEHLLNLTKDHKERGDYMLKLADLYMDLNHKDKASKLYSSYRLLYPGSQHLKYVMYQEIIANLADSMDHLRDQSKTNETLELAQSFQEEFPEDVEFHDSIKDVIEACYRKLLKNDLAVAQYYIRRWSYEDNVKSLKAAQRRIEHALKEYTPHLVEGAELLSLTSRIDLSTPQAHADSMTGVINEVFDYLTKIEGEATPFWRFW